ncbi:hypothetical protein PIB30_095148, partial [Stylosanthes scabra]|nr:hypothetical protein [Stylosanthes scabra]
MPHTYIHSRDYILSDVGLVIVNASHGRGEQLLRERTDSLPRWQPSQLAPPSADAAAILQRRSNLSRQPSTLPSPSPT